MRKIVVVSGTILAAVSLILAGILLIGNHFLRKGHDYVEQYRSEREQRADEKREEKVVAAQEANFDEAEIRKLRVLLKKEKYEKSTGRRDLEKEIRKSEYDLKIWYFAEDDEDLDQIAGYAELYKKRAREYFDLWKNAAEETRKYETEAENLRKELATTGHNEKLGAQNEKLSAEIEKMLALFEKTKAEYAVTPTFRRYKVEKKLREIKKALEKKRKTAARLLEKLSENERALESLTYRIRVADENATESRRREEKYQKEIRICRAAEKITRKILKHTETIREINAKISELETARDDKKIDAYL